MREREREREVGKGEPVIGGRVDDLEAMNDERSSLLFRTGNVLVVCRGRIQ